MTNQETLENTENIEKSRKMKFLRFRDRFRNQFDRVRVHWFSPFTGSVIDPRESKEFILGLLKEFDWAYKLIRLTPPSSYKDFVVVDRYHKLPWAFSDVSKFDEGCVFDAEVDSARTVVF